MTLSTAAQADHVEAAWAVVRANLRTSIGARLFDQWIKPARLIPGGERDVIRLGLPSPFVTNWVSSHYADRLLLEFRGQLPEVRRVSIETATGDMPVEPIESVSAPAVQAAPAAPASVGPLPDRPVLEARFTFDRFVTDPSNQVAFNAARALAEPGVPRFSPLFLHGGTGQGKTHLMHAIGHAFMAHTPGANVIMMSAERFMFDFVTAMRARDTLSFKTRLRSVDLLMIDDVQFIAGKDATQEEFFHTINEVTGAGKRLVISADRSPQSLDGIEGRILSRLSGGLVADIKAPGLDLRRAILRSKLAGMDAGVPDDVVELLAERISSNIRELEGALNRLVAYATLTGTGIDMDFAQATLTEVLRGTQRRVTIDDIQRAVSTHFDLRQLDLVSARRARVVARPRQIAMYLAKRMTARSLPEIGRKFGGRDHSTVIHAVKRIEELRASDSELDGDVRTLIRQLEG